MTFANYLSNFLFQVILSRISIRGNLGVFLSEIKLVYRKIRNNKFKFVPFCFLHLECDERKLYSLNQLKSRSILKNIGMNFQILMNIYINFCNYFKNSDENSHYCINFTLPITFHDS